MVGKDEDVFLITEGWTIPGTFEEFKKYRVKVLAILEEFEPEFVFYSHPFDWAFESGDGEYPRGTEIMKFKDEKTAREAIAAIENSGVRAEEGKVFSRVRSYLSRRATQNDWAKMGAPERAPL